MFTGICVNGQQPSNLRPLIQNLMKKVNDLTVLTKKLGNDVLANKRTIEGLKATIESNANKISELIDEVVNNRDEVIINRDEVMTNREAIHNLTSQLQPTASGYILNISCI